MVLYLGYEGLYNFFNIGATSSTETLGAIKKGLQFARDGKGASEEIKANLLLPWDTPEKAIKGGAVFIGSSYISVGQNTLYLQKFDVNDDRGQDLFWHQYMTNCLAPYNESYNIHKAYNSLGLLSASIGFIIPVYDNMPEYPTQSPNILNSDFQADNTKVYADVTTTLNVRTGPSTSYEILTSITRTEQMTRIGKGIQNGETWDKVILSNGMIGYVFQNYIKEVEVIEPDNPTEEPEIPPEEIEKPIEPEEEIPPIQETPGEVPEEIEFDNTLKINDENIISGLKYSEVIKVRDYINTKLQYEFYNSKNELLTDDDNIGTGSKVIFKNDNNETLYEYIFIIYGDVNGDGIINSLDVLVMQKHILETKLLTGIFLKAGNISKNGNPPSSLDVLKIQKHILEIKIIEQ